MLLDTPLLRLSHSSLPLKGLLDTLINALLLIDHQVGLIVELGLVCLYFDDELLVGVFMIHASVHLPEAALADHLIHFVPLQEQDALSIANPLLAGWWYSSLSPPSG